MDYAHRLIAAFFESTEAGRKLAASEPDLVNAKTDLGETPLHYLAVENQIDAVQALVEIGADLNNVNSCGGTPLSEASRLGYAKLVQYLLSVGAKLQVDGQSELVLHEAASSGNIDVVQALIGAGADVNACNDLSEAALHIAAGKDHAEVVRLLVEAGADASLRRIFDETPLDVARNNGSVATEKVLLSLIGRDGVRSG